jgi:hypothetical protein
MEDHTSVINLESILSKLETGQRLYVMASKKIHNAPMTDRFQVLSDQKERFIKELEQVFKLNSYEYKIAYEDRVKLLMEKAGIELDNIFIRRNEKEVISFCLNREKELLVEYNALMREYSFDGTHRSYLVSQRDFTHEVIKKLEETYESYNFLNKEFNENQ